MSFGEKLQQLRKIKGFSQEQLAEKLGVTRQAISKWELNDSLPDIDKIVQLSTIFSVTTDYLLKEDCLLKKDDRKVELDKNVITQSIFCIAAGISFIGLITAVIIYDYSQYPILSAGIGFIIQTIGYLLFECILPFLSDREKIHNTRFKFYAINIWFFLPIPYWFVATTILNIFPEVFSYPLTFAAMLILILLCAGFSRYFLKQTSKK